MCSSDGWRESPDSRVSERYCVENIAQGKDRCRTTERTRGVNGGNRDDRSLLSNGIETAFVVKFSSRNSAC